MAKVAKQRRVWMFPKWYRVITSPDPLIDADGRRCQILPDHVDRVLWLDPYLTEAEAKAAIVVAAADAWMNRYQESSPAD